MDGSGGALHFLLDWHRDWYLEHGSKKEIYQGPGGQWHLATAEKKCILLNNIYGVDIDSQAVEVTKLSLLLKVLEHENRETLERQLRLLHERALPDLAGNDDPAAPTVLGIDGTRFTIHGRPTFLLGASYYGGLGASDALRGKAASRAFSRLGRNGLPSLLPSTYKRRWICLRRATMLNRWNKRHGCAQLRANHRLHRRSFLQAGLLGAGGLSLAELLRSEARAGSRADREASVIILWMRGGPSHIDMWDPKPEAPVEYRGEFGSMGTSVPGITLTDMLPQSAAIMHKWSIVRSLTHQDAGHSTADQTCFTGYPPGANPDENVMPSCGSIVAEQLGHQRRDLPSYVMVPRMVPGTGPAYLGVAYKPFETMADPAQPGPFSVPNFAVGQGLTYERLATRRDLLSGFDRLRREIDTQGQIRAIDRFHQQAWDILSSSAARDAFDLDREPAAMRERYGLMPGFDPGASNRCGAPNWSQRMLLARRLVEAGVRLVTVDLRWWDTHVLGFDSMRRGFLPRFDRAYSALIEDLDERGLLDSTLVIAWGEFGRTPRVNKDAGRDHYPNVFSAAVAGGGVKGGRVVGSSDDHGAFPRTNPKSPQDVLATLYRHLQIDTEKQYVNAAGRPITVLPSGAPINELF